MAARHRPGFDWDVHNIRHLARHAISPGDFEQAMGHSPVLIDVRDEEGEDRWYALGATEDLRVLFMVYTYRGERIRPVTAWEAGRKLRELYFRMKVT
jgi:uncharacterized DUF497 family protein